MDSQTGSVIPGIISKQELLYAGTMIEITNMVELTARTIDQFGKNISEIQERDFYELFFDNILNESLLTMTFKLNGSIKSQVDQNESRMSLT